MAWDEAKAWLSGTLNGNLYQNLLDDALTRPARNARRKKIIRPEDMLSLQRNDAGVWLCEYSGLSFQRSPVCACSLVSSLLLSGATMSQQSSLSLSAYSVRQVLTAYMANAKSIGWAIYAAGFVIWLFGYLSTGHAVA